MKVNVQKLHPAASLPTYATPGAACFDLRTIEHGRVPARGSAKFRTGLAFEVPAGHVLKVYSRSGHGFKNGLRLSNATGIVDSDYRGELMVSITNDSATAFEFEPGDRIAQAMILPFPQVELVEADSLSETARGAGGFGSTGA
ncbi:MAG: dUTP diphosphatase [Aestuariivirga sp.]